LRQVCKDREANRLTRATVRSHVSEHYKQTPSVSNECNKLHTSAVSCQDLTTAQTHTRHIQRGHPTSANTPLQRTPHFSRHPTSADTPLQQTSHFSGHPTSADGYYQICKKLLIFTRAVPTSTAADACRRARLSIAVPQLRLISTDTRTTSYIFVQLTTIILSALIMSERESENHSKYTRGARSSF